MKKLLIVLILFTASCTEEKSDPAPTYTSIQGVWKFETKDISGQFEVVSYNGSIVVDNGYYNQGGKRYTVTAKQAVTGVPPGKFTMFLISGSNELAFRDCDVNKTYDQVTVNLFSYVVDSKPYSGTAGFILKR
jgi:hypothetical protein